MSIFLFSFVGYFNYIQCAQALYVTAQYLTAMHLPALSPSNINIGKSSMPLSLSDIASNKAGLSCNLKP